MKQKLNREFVTNVVRQIEPFKREYTVYRHAKKNQKSFRITQKLLQGIIAHANKIKKLPELIITIPANLKENYIIKCSITKQRKV